MGYAREGLRRRIAENNCVASVCNPSTWETSAGGLLRPQNETLSETKPCERLLERAVQSPMVRAHRLSSEFLLGRTLLAPQTDRDPSGVSLPSHLLVSHQVQMLQMLTVEAALVLGSSGRHRLISRGFGSFLSHVGPSSGCQAQSQAPSLHPMKTFQTDTMIFSLCSLHRS